MYYVSKAANALKCAVTSGFVNMWYLLGSVYYALELFGQGSLMEDQINNYYPTVCSCLLEVDQYLQMFEQMFSSGLSGYVRRRLRGVGGEL